MPSVPKNRTKANSADPDQTPQHATSDQYLHYLDNANGYKRSNRNYDRVVNQNRDFVDKIFFAGLV